MGAAAAGEMGPVGAAGGDDVLWAYRDVSDGAETNPLWRLAFCVMDREGRLVWRRPWGQSDVTGHIRVGAVSGARLHLWYGDGTHRYYERRRSGVGLTMPDAAVPLAVAGDARDGSLYAVVRRSVAVAIEEGDPPDGARPEGVNGEDGPKTDEGSDTVPIDRASRWPDASHVLLRLDGGRWRGDRALPSKFEPDGGVWLTASGGAISVVWWRNGDSGRYWWSESAAAEAPWSAAARLDGLSAGEIASVDVYEGHLLLVTARGDGKTISTLRRVDGEWVAGTPFERIASRGQTTSRPAYARLASSVVGVWVSDDGTVNSAAWGIEGGPVSSLNGAVRALTPNTDARAWDWRRVMLSYVVLVLVLGAVFLRRRRSVTDSVRLPAELHLAGHGRRLLAFGIDAAMFYPCAVYAYVPLLREYAYNLAALWHAAMSDSEVMSAFTWRWVAAVGGFIGYTIVFETWWGATPGKRLTRIRVVDEQGGRCGFGRVVVRNVLRGVEFFPFLDLLPTLVLVLLTRNRQRLGDLVGGTVVVERTAQKTDVDTWA